MAFLCYVYIPYVFFFGDGKKKEAPKKEEPKREKTTVIYVNRTGKEVLKGQAALDEIERLRRR